MDTIPFHQCCTGQDEIDAVNEVISSGWLTFGAKSVAFETAFSDFVKSDHAVSVNSATAALHLSLKAIGVQAGDEVIVPSLTFVATAEVVTYFGAIPVLCDVDYDTHNLDVTKVEALITSKTKAIIPVHFAGCPCDMDAIIEIASRHNLRVIEDAAHAMPSFYNGKPIGSVSDLTCFSFYATKTLTTGEGGMVTTNDEQLAQKIKSYRLHGIRQDAWDRYRTKGKWFYEVTEQGFKYNTTDMNAAMGLVQLNRQKAMLARRRVLAERYISAFQNLPIAVQEIPDFAASCWHLFVIKVEDRDAVMAALDEAKIGYSLHFIPIHVHPYYADTFAYNADDYPISNQIYESCLSLPIYPDLTDEDQDRVIRSVCQAVDS